VAVDAKVPKISPKEIAAALRRRVLRIKPDDIGLKQSSITNSAVWGVVIETAHPDAVASLVALLDGSVSLYVSDGNGCIGCGNQREVRQAGANLLQIAVNALPLAIATDDIELPPSGVVRFYLLARDGVHCTQIRLEDINNADERLSQLYFSGQRTLATIEQTGAGQSIAQEIQLALNSGDYETGDPPCLSVGNVVRRLRT
jgi:hypothetical protein